MSANIIKSLAVAALLSTTLMNGVIACDVDAAELGDVSKGIGKVLHALRDYDLTAHPEIAPLLAKVDHAISKGTPLHSSFNKDSLNWIVINLDSLYLALETSDTKDEAAARVGLATYRAPADIADIFDTPGGSTVDPVKAHWDSFLASDHGLRIQSKAADKTLNFHGKMKASDFLAQPGDLSEAQARARAATDYYRSDNALPRNIDLVRDLKRQVAAGGSPLLDSEVDAAIGAAGFPPAILKKLTATDGKVRLGEALAELKRQKDQTAALLKANTAEMDRLRLAINAAKVKK